MLYLLILDVHIGAGIAALLSGAASMGFRKGSRRHVLSGRVFLVAMLTMAVGAVYLGIVHHEPPNTESGIITFYLVGTGWLAAKRRGGESGRIDWVALLIPLTLGTLFLVNGIRVVLGSSENGVPVGMDFFLGSICLLAAAGDVRLLIRGGVFGSQRIARHLWRMCFGLFIATGSFLFGPSNRPLRLLSPVGARHLPSALFSMGLYLFLTALPLLLLIFWLIRVRFTNAFKKRMPPPPPARPVPQES